MLCALVKVWGLVKPRAGSIGLPLHRSFGSFRGRMAGERPQLYVVDGSSYIYRAFHALPPLTNARGVPTQAVYGFTTMLGKLLTESQPDSLVVVFDAPGKTFRDDFYASYKANRPSMPDDLRSQIPWIHKIVDAFRVCKIVQGGVEADDVIATLVTRYSTDFECVVVTGDKDLMQLVGPGVRLWDTMRDRWVDVAAVREKFGVDPKQVVDVMALMGDPVDNVPGVKGIGGKTAAALIETFGDLETLLDRVDDVANMKLRGAAKVAERLRDGADDARLSRRLVELNTCVDFDLEMSDMALGAPDRKTLSGIFAELGFETLLDQVVVAQSAASVDLIEVADPSATNDALAQVTSDETLAVAVLGVAGPAQTTAASRVAFADQRRSVVVSLADEAVRKNVSGALEAYPGRVIGYDLKRVRQGLTLSDVSLPAAGFDVLVAAYLVDPGAKNDFASIATANGGLRVSDYGNDDAATCAALVEMHGIAERLSQRMRDADVERLFVEVETPLTDVLARIEMCGMALDTALLEKMGEEFGDRLENLMREIYELAGHPFNINSPPQLRTVLFEELNLPTRGVKKGKTGYSTDADVLGKLSAEHPLPGKILAYRNLAKLKSTYIDALPQAVDPRTGRLHTTLHQTVAATGRLTSSDPNLQNIPIRGDEGRRIREAFVAPPGRVLVGADYSQIELRVLAHLSRDPVLLEAFHEKQDIHTRTAAEVFDVLPGTVSAEMRRAAKVINFGILYGMGPQRLSRDLGISMKEARKYIDNYFERYSGVRGLMDRLVEQARVDGFVSTILGRRRLLPEFKRGHRGAIQAAERIAANTPIQGSAADIIKVAMVNVDRALSEEFPDAFMILQVHDELLVEATIGEEVQVADLMRREMASAVVLDVPLDVELGFGPNWSVAH